MVAEAAFRRCTNLTVVAARLDRAVQYAGRLHFNAGVPAYLIPAFPGRG
jgi:hypothetical protein